MVFPPRHWGTKTPYFGTVFDSTKLCRMQKNKTAVFIQASANACYNYGASGIRWRRITVNYETIEIKSPKHFKLTLAYRRVALSGNKSLIATFSSLFYFNRVMRHRTEICDSLRTSKLSMRHCIECRTS